MESIARQAEHHQVRTSDVTLDRAEEALRTTIAARPSLALDRAEELVRDIVRAIEELTDVVPSLPIASDDDPRTELRLSRMAGYARWNGLATIAAAIDDRVHPGDHLQAVSG